MVPPKGKAQPPRPERQGPTEQEMHALIEQHRLRRIAEAQERSRLALEFVPKLQELVVTSRPGTTVYVTCGRDFAPQPTLKLPSREVLLALYNRVGGPEWNRRPHVRLRDDWFEYEIPRRWEVRFPPTALNRYHGWRNKPGF